MRPASSEPSTWMIARWPLLLVLAACGSRSGLDGDLSGASSDASVLDVADVPVDGDAPADGADAANEVSAPRLDAAACFALPVAACTSDPPFDNVLQGAIVQCSSRWMCGYVDVTFDADGCALSFVYEGGVVPGEFRACFEAVVSSQRWPCEVGQSLFTFLGSCTIN